jgi:tetratricopeptide (TPR) repeat protein
MNLSVLERMAVQGDMSIDACQYLKNCRCECEYLDYKEILTLEDDKQLCDFAKDALATKNVGGGYFLIGIRDKDWEPVGLSKHLAYDSKILRDKIRRATDVDLDIDIVHHQLEIAGKTKLFALILVRSSKKRKKRRSPTLCNKDFCQNKPFGLRRGQIYIRKGDSSKLIQSQEELEKLLEDIEERIDQDAIEASGEGSPFAIQDGPYRLLEKGYGQFIGREDLRKSIFTAITKDPRIWIINVHGPGGVGKTATCNWIVYEHYERRTFESIIQLTAKVTELTPTGIKHCSRTLCSLENLLDHILNAFEEDISQELEKKKLLAVELLSSYHTLLVLDNMETVSDGRILDFIQKLPPDTRCKVLITSRMKTGGWELPISMRELNCDEVREFVQIRGKEIGIKPIDNRAVIRNIWKASGGLPLAIQWILGTYKRSGDLDSVLEAVSDTDSPVLEFSFRNIWKLLTPDSRAVLAAISIFDEPPSIQQISISTEFKIEKIEEALAELADVTLVNKHTSSDGKVRYVALPITLAFANNQAVSMGDFELNCRKRLQKFNSQMELHESELQRFNYTFMGFGITSDHEKRAVILCRRGESEMFIGREENAELLFKQARELAPESAYVLAMCASYKLASKKVGEALSIINEACGRVTKKTGALCYTIKSRVLYAQGDKEGQFKCLEKALEYSQEDLIIRHQYGVALSRLGNYKEAIRQFTIIIDKEKQHESPTDTLLIALKTRIINYNRLNMKTEASNDLEFAKQMITKYPHLANCAYYFTEFEHN